MKIFHQLAFDGTASKALRLYQKAFGCTVKTMVLYRDAVEQGWEKPNENLNDRIYHSEIMFGDYELRMTDFDNAENTALTQKITINVGFDSEEEVRKTFSILSEEGTVIRELTYPPYMVIIGKVRDKFGISWNLMCDYQS